MAHPLTHRTFCDRSIPTTSSKISPIREGLEARFFRWGGKWLEISQWLPKLLQRKTFWGIQLKGGWFFFQQKMLIPYLELESQTVIFVVKHLFFISHDLFGCHPTDRQPSFFKRGRELGTCRWKKTTRNELFERVACETAVPCYVLWKFQLKIPTESRFMKHYVSTSRSAEHLIVGWTEKTVLTLEVGFTNHQQFQGDILFSSWSDQPIPRLIKGHQWLIRC